MYDINYKTISKKDQLRMIRNKYKTLKEQWLDMEETKRYRCGGVYTYTTTEAKMLLVKEILDDVYNWDADNDCSF